MCRAALQLALLASLSAVPDHAAAQGAAAGAPDEARLVDMVVAQVDTTVITWSELLAETRLVMLRSRGPEFARSGAITEPLLQAVLRSIVSRELLLSEARRLHLRDVAEADVQGVLGEIGALFETPGDHQRFLERIGFSTPVRRPSAAPDPQVAPPGLVAVLRAELQVARFIQLRIRPGIVLREADVQRCYELNRHLLGDEPLAGVRPLIERALRQARSDAALAALVAQLERRTTVRYSAGFELPPMGRPEEAAPRDALELRCPSDEAPAAP